MPRRIERIAQCSLGLVLRSVAVPPLSERRRTISPVSAHTSRCWRDFRIRTSDKNRSELTRTSGIASSSARASRRPSPRLTRITVPSFARDVAAVVVIDISCSRAVLFASRTQSPISFATGDGERGAGGGGVWSGVVHPISKAQAVKGGINHRTRSRGGGYAATRWSSTCAISFRRRLLGGLGYRIMAILVPPRR